MKGKLIFLERGILCQKHSRIWRLNRRKKTISLSSYWKLDSGQTRRILKATYPMFSLEKSVQKAVQIILGDNKYMWKDKKPPAPGEITSEQNLLSFIKRYLSTPDYGTAGIIKDINLAKAVFSICFKKWPNIENFYGLRICRHKTGHYAIYINYINNGSIRELSFKPAVTKPPDAPSQADTNTHKRHRAKKRQKTQRLPLNAKNKTRER